MEKYYCVIVQNNSTQAVFAYDSYDAALAKFHTELAYRAEGRTSTLCVILDSNGIVQKSEKWFRTAPEA